SWISVQAVQPHVDPVFESDVVDRYDNHIYYGSGATGMALVVIDGNQRVFRRFGETRTGNNQHQKHDSVISIASLRKLM
ncbi:D-alanyl-D-alanine-carboxypeptidase/endopeptidase AmpH, partial [Klebsiella pneumoniae]|nr:D-alanyl-D-alanine-carboxypeptidase/endopeptidase AmpH [Klebsiella pneumoniae]